MSSKLTDEDVNSKTVISALYALRGHETPVTADALAQYLKCSEVRVLQLLRQLKKQRLVKDYYRKAGRVWGTW